MDNKVTIFGDGDAQRVFQATPPQDDPRALGED